MENNKEYQKHELVNFVNQKHSYFDTVKEFSDNLEDMDILEQINWIENGSYGAGACFALQNTLNHISKRMNANSHIGSIVLHVFYGKHFRYWGKLSDKAKKAIDEAVIAWINQEHNFASILEI